MDICTLIVITTIPLIGCSSDESCRMSSDGTKKYCIPPHSISCPTPENVYECVKEDGTKYLIKESEAK